MLLCEYSWAVVTENSSVLEMLESLGKAWEPARKAGVIGPQSVESLNDHASGFIISEWKNLSQGHFVDLGTGAGIPGILLAISLPTSRWVLIDASQRRCKFASVAVDALNLNDRVCVRHMRIGQFARLREARERFDGATARLFGPAAELAECGLPLLKIGAAMVVSVSENTEKQWKQKDLPVKTGCEVVSDWSTPQGNFIAIKRVLSAPETLPRRAAARRRLPLI